MNDILGLDRRALDRARKSRDARFDGKFFIAVTSTRIYCRPICPAPSPKQVHIRYYPTAAAAAEAGFRPCLRCRPETAPGTPAWLGTSAVVQRALRLIQEGALDDASVEALAERLGIGPRHLHRLFVQHVGAAPITVAQTRRLHFAKHLLDETDLAITEIALAAGFGSVRRFNDTFRSTYQRAPRELRRQRHHGIVGETRGEVVLELAFRPPYDWAHVHSFLATRALPGVERVDETGYARTVSLDGGPAIVQVQPVSGRNVLRLRVRGAAPSALFALACAARRMFDLAADPARIARGFEPDAHLHSLVKERPGLRIPGAWDPFECAVRAVLGQQVSVAAGRTLAIRLVARLGRRIAEGTHGLSHLFPAPADLARADLDGLGLTRARALALQALARAVCQGAVDFSRPVDEVTTSLAALPGIGDWTAQYIALRALGEPDAFPAADLVLRRMAGADGSPLSTRELATRSLAWRPWRGYAVFHLWRASGAGTSKVVPQQPRSLRQRARPGTEGSTKRRALGADIRSTYGP